MSQERWKKIEEIFNKALILPVEQRTSFIARKSAGDIELCNEINELVSEAESDEKLLDDSIFTFCRQLIRTELKLGSAVFDENTYPF